MWGNLFLIILGISGGAAVGTAVLAIYAVFDFVSMLREYCSYEHFDHRLEFFVLSGALFSTVFYHFKFKVPVPILFLPLIGLFFGGFIGLLVASMSDVIGLIPLLSSKRKERISIPIMIFFMAIGRSVGSLYFFLTTRR
jgi:stage V sporulation protein AB